MAANERRWCKSSRNHTSSCTTRIVHCSRRPTPNAIRFLCIRQCLANPRSWCKPSIRRTCLCTSGIVHCSRSSERNATRLSSVPQCLGKPKSWCKSSKRLMHSCTNEWERPDTPERIYVRIVPGGVLESADILRSAFLLLAAEVDVRVSALWLVFQQARELKYSRRAVLPPSVVHSRTPTNNAGPVAIPARTPSNNAVPVAIPALELSLPCVIALGTTFLCPQMFLQLLPFCRCKPERVFIFFHHVSPRDAHTFSL
ncbi:uncharacterized protein LOC119181625 isoform X1 [Rhipicephalus microplus]|uniref:uncharacterized protein LOC119181625 isoform X1 n=1 Tax=Rhipicephalus microplus TaxID=6941 RepID=UPI003F6B012D